MIRNLLEKFKRRESHQLRVMVVLFMLVLLAAQLIWWVVFFELNARRTDELSAGLDELYLAAANAGRPAETNGRIIRVNGEYRINPKVIEERENRHARNLLMLISESIFLMAVICYGSYRVIRSIQREFQLIQDRNTFINSVSHELKTPIASILLNLQTLLKRELPEEQRREMLEDGVRDIHRLDAQVNNLLTAGAMSRNPAGMRDLHTAESLEPAREIEAYLEAFRGENKQRPGDSDVRFETDLQACPPVAMNPEMFHKVLSNIIGNSAQYAQGPVRIHISLRPAASHKRSAPDIALIRISDDGPGLPPGEHEKVFQPLYRLQAGNRPVRGTGMGLYIVREIVSAAGGSVTAESAGASGGRGTTMEIRLPLGGQA